MSCHSQPLNTISHSENSLMHHQIYRPKYLNDQDDKLNSTIDYQSNKLPLNLFHSAAEYNKMLITYGKNRKKHSSQITDGIIPSLEYVNDRIFDKEISIRAKAKQSIQYSVKPSKKQIQKCSCCCCSEFCHQCSPAEHNCRVTSHTDMKKAKKTIDNEIIRVRKGRKGSINTSVKNSSLKSKNKSKKSGHLQQSSRAYSAKDKQNKILGKKDDSYPSYSQKSKGVDISHLVIKSLVDFTQKKKAQERLKKSKQSTEKAKQQYLQILNQKIRSNNLQASQQSKSRPKQKSASKNELAVKYWDQIKEDVFKSLKGDNYSKPMKKQLMNYKFSVYEQKQAGHRKNVMSKQQIEFLRQKHAQQAMLQIDEQIRRKQKKSKKIKRNLQSLQKQRLDRIRSNPQVRFQPTAEMIQNAFKNIIQPTLQDIQNEKKYNQNSRGANAFRNQAIRTKNRRN